MALLLTNPLARIGYPALLNAIMSSKPPIPGGINTSVPNARTQRSLKNGLIMVPITIMQHGIAYDDIYNFDETGYAMGLTATAKVVTRADMYGRRQVIQPGNREWVTSIECVNSMGWVLPPCTIFKGSVHIEGWYQESKLSSNWRIEVIPNGWTSDEIGLRWLQKVFIPETSSRMTGRYCLLVLDGHGSHPTPEFDKTCSGNNIIPVCMPPHSSNYCQPLDVCCFSPLKRTYGNLVQNRMQHGFNHMDKLDFLEAYPDARKQAFASDTIKNGFRATDWFHSTQRRCFGTLLFN